MKRFCIYLTYDRQNIVDEYIGYMLKELKSCVDYLVVVCNETTIVRGREILQTYADEVFYRENIGLDAGGFKAALTELVGWEKVLSFDELVLVNDSIFGPFCPMKDIFREMSKKEVDFWGLSGHGEYRREELDSFPEHIQSFFITVRSAMLHSSQFKDYWETMPYYGTYNQVVREYEMQFTRIFSNFGYTYDVLADVEANNSSNPANNYCQFRRISCELIKKRNFPFLKKQQIAEDKLDEQTQQELYQAIDYIDKSTDYDVNLIWRNVIRTLNITDLQRNLHLQYIIPEEQHDADSDQKIVIIVCISHDKSAEYVLEYLTKLDSEIKIIADDKELLNDYKRYGYECETVLQKDRLTYFKGFCTYDMVCILNDTDMTSEARPNYIGKSYFFGIWNNLIKDKNHILGIQKLFKTNPYLGMLTSPQSNFGIFLGSLGGGWEGGYEEILRIVKTKKYQCQISEDKPPFNKFENFWIRGELLKSLNSWKSEEFRYLPYIWGYIAQDSGYYSGIVESSEYAVMNEVNLQYYLEQIVELIRTNYGEFDDIIGLKKKIFQASLYEFCKSHKSILIYGTGILARKYKSLLPKAEAYVISDGQMKVEDIDGIPVKYLSEIVKLEDYGIVLCLNKKNQVQAIEQLEQYGAKDYLCI